MRHDRLLRTTLTANAAFSGLAGLVTAALSGVLAEPLGIPRAVLVVVGLGLVPYALMLRRFAADTALGPAQARIAIGADLAWVVASIAVLAVSPASLTTLGHWVIGVVALGVGDFAALQWVGMRRLPDGATGLSSTPRGRQPAAP